MVSGNFGVLLYKMVGEMEKNRFRSCFLSVWMRFNVFIRFGVFRTDSHVDWAPFISRYAILLSSTDETTMHQVEISVKKRMYGFWWLL